MTEEKRSYGKSRSGVELTDEVIERMAAEAEAGLDVTKLRRRPGRPRMGSAPAEPLPVRFWALTRHGAISRPRRAPGRPGRCRG